MPFRRRKPVGHLERLRAVLWPSMGFRRSLRYLKLRLVRLSASPYSVAAGVAVGVAVAWTPFLGVHIIIAMALAFILRANLVAAALGTTFANPLTFPLIWAATWELGHVILGRNSDSASSQVDFAAMFSHMNFLHLWAPVLEPMTIGAIIPGALSAIVAYFSVYAVIRGFRAQKHQMLAQQVADRKSALGVTE
ncbi:DUF2062 domain-containing protein [Agrobacterium rosae]|uniref:DUF2062 domain-containing protein n=1 Tax=Agrobacterium rosae TaxID=1972867 RepID=A0AAW9FIG3_9HYPH|nr:DUF2062 domain-containing protein [Agrobacterium rosae]MBN7804717.1 DUF2062 domain-containing protein [Agrobacterium rosae]MDX8303344.1 DUF2062 domain-containing protein [Agrobacterium rosae]POO53061.1 hypothetical protein CTT39_19855 [Agrobacterium rosae]